MTWWAWLLVFVALAIGSVVVLFLQARGVWRSAAALFTELGEASRTVEEVMAARQATSAGAAAQAPPPDPPDLAIFDSAARLRQDRARGHR